MGYLGKKPLSGDVMREGIKILQHRGYDSAGIVTLDAEGNIVLTKNAS